MRLVPLRVLLAPLLAALIIPGTAAAATIGTFNRDPFPWWVIYTSAAGESDDVTVTRGGGGGGGTWVFNTGYPPPLYPGTLCSAVQQLLTISCPAFDTGLLRFTLADGDDFVRLNYAATVAAVEFDGGEGNDRLELTATAATGAITANGGPGRDTLNGGPAADTLDGGDDDDTFGPVAGADVLTGGPGVDSAVFTGVKQPLQVTLDGLANDGVIGQNARVDVENVTGGDVDDQLAGDAGPNRLNGGTGNDFLQGNGGADVLQGDAGDDRIEARDGVADTVDCGFGTDTAVVDPADTVAGCETVVLPDVDGDGVPVTLDCDDANPAIRPGAVDVAGNGVDEDCSGADAVLSVVPAPAPGSGTPPPPVVAPMRIASPVLFGWNVRKTYTSITRAVVRDLPAGARVLITCKGKGCPKRATVTPKKGTADLTKRFAGRRLAPGAKIEVRVLAEGAIGKVVTVTILRKKDPALKTECLPPGAARPQRCA